MAKDYVIDANGAGFDPIPISQSHRRSLERAVIRQITSIPEGVRDVLSCYSPEPTLWELPPLMAGSFDGVSLQLAPDKDMQHARPALANFNAFVRLFAAEGWSERMCRSLGRLFGPMAGHDYVFDKDNTDPLRFAVEYVTASSRRLSLNLIANDNTYAVGYYERGEMKLAGIVDGKLEATGLTTTAEEIYNILYSPRGTVQTHFYGAYDRALLWVTQGFTFIDEADGMRMALTILKLTCNHRAERDFETTLRSEKTVKVVMSKANVTEDFIENVRDTWIESSNSTPEEALQKVFNLVVPKVYDSLRFIRLVGRKPEIDDKFTPRQIATIDKGIERMTLDLYKQVQGRNVRKSSRRS